MEFFYCTSFSSSSWTHKHKFGRPALFCLKVLKRGSLLTYVWNINWGIGSLVPVDGNRKGQKEAKILPVGGSPLISAHPGPVPLGLVHSRWSLNEDGEMREEEYEMQLCVDLWVQCGFLEILGNGDSCTFHTGGEIQTPWSLTLPWCLTAAHKAVTAGIIRGRRHFCV